MGSAELPQKQEVISGARRHAKDTGSPEVQIGLLTKRLEVLAQHFSKHKKDTHSSRGLTQLVSRRKRLLNYLRQTDADRYKDALNKFGLRK